MGERQRWSTTRVVLLIAVLVGTLAGGVPPVTADETARLRYHPSALDLEYDRASPPQADPGKLRRAILLSGHGGAVYLMVWDLARLHPAEWLERALGPVTTGARSWSPAWIPDADFAGVVEVPPGQGTLGMRVYAIRLGETGVAVLCHGVDAAALSAACDAIAGSLEVRR